MKKTNKNLLILALLMAVFVTTPAAFAYETEGMGEGIGLPTTTQTRPANPEPNWRTSDIDLKQKGLPTMSPEKRAEMEKMRDQVQGMREDLKEKKGEMKEYTKDMRAKIQQTAAQMVGNRVAAMFERITKLQSRIDSRMQKLAQAGKDVTVAKAHLDASQKALTEARTKATAIQLSNTSDFKTVKESVKAVQTLLQTAHKELQLSVAAMQKVSGEVKATTHTKSAQ